MTHRDHQKFESEDTGSKQDTRFKPGQSGNPSGRPKGARSRLGEQFIQALVDDFDEHGDAVIKVVRARDPVAYLKVIKDILPREVTLRAFATTATIDLTAIEAAEGRLAAYKYARDFISPVIEAKPIEAKEDAVVAEGWRRDDDY